MNLLQVLEEHVVEHATRAGQTGEEFRQSKYIRDAVLLALRAMHGDKNEISDCISAMTKAIGLLATSARPEILEVMCKRIAYERSEYLRIFIDQFPELRKQMKQDGVL